MRLISSEKRRHMIAEAAYFRAERRGFRGGDPVDDWLEAERDVDAGLGTDAAAHEGLEERLAAANEKLRAFRHRLTELTDEAREHLEEDIVAIARQRDAFRQRIREARRHSGEAAERARMQAEKLWDEISDKFERLTRHRSGRSQ